MALPSSRVSTLVVPSSLLLVLLALAAAATEAEADPAQDAPQDEMTTRRFPVPPSPDQGDVRAVFRLKEMHPCKCENGGRCNRRVRKCECPFGFGGARCEKVDHEYFAERRALDAAAKERELQQEQQAVDSAAPGCYPATALWLVYVAAVVATVLLLLMLRAFALIAASIYQGEKDKPHALPDLYNDDVGNIYTLPLRPPPYSEKVAPAICSSTPLARPDCCAQRLLELQLQPDYLRTLQPLQHEQQPEYCCIV
ncbi:hypothetical protein PMAYCL1PPCAC_19923 [Pristionchus mayeri]|uniref:EGF-like domain-containing protein n=1 Tax=Pristionchus mayeri TaxID=1317129 RepID=A0AAN5CS48_9BILA|nr:hypothetical protein PMAYCL1PPCAC_19923 [Pristionchus mayeri]